MTGVLLSCARTFKVTSEPNITSLASFWKFGIRGAAVSGSLGVAPGANLNPPRQFPSMFEPIHGSAPDIAGRGIANPIAQILSLAMLLRFSLGETQAADAIENAVAKTIADGFRTGDIATGRDGETKVGTKAMGDAVLSRL